MVEPAMHDADELPEPARAAEPRRAERARQATHATDAMHATDTMRAPGVSARRAAAPAVLMACVAVAIGARCAPVPRATPPADTTRPSAAGEIARDTNRVAPARTPRRLAPLGITAATGALARADLGDLSAVLAAAPDD